jgi:hypothetical protein
MKLCRMSLCRMPLCRMSWRPDKECQQFVILSLNPFYRRRLKTNEKWQTKVTPVWSVDVAQWHCTATTDHEIKGSNPARYSSTHEENGWYNNSSRIFTRALWENCNRWESELPQHYDNTYKDFTYNIHKFDITYVCYLILQVKSFISKAS